MAESLFRGTIEFLDQVGMYDVVLPFLLVFTIVFAILEKTKILGISKINGKEVTKKNLNSIFSFVLSFLVIASTRIVSIINETLASVVLLLILAVSFMLLVGSFYGDKEFSLENSPGWVKFFMIFMFIGVVLIFLNSLDWLAPLINFITKMDGEWASSLVFLLITAGFMWMITREPSKGGSKKD